MTKQHRPWGYHSPIGDSAVDWKLHPDTLAVRAGLARSGFNETGEAIYLTSGFTYSSADEAAAAFSGDTDHFVYSRFNNPTVAMFENRMAALEGAEAAMATASGMAAMFASVASVVAKGDRVVASFAMFSSCYVVLSEILPKWGVEVEFVHGNEQLAWEKALSKPTKVVFVETPSNPMLEIVDLKMVSTLAHNAGAILIVDNIMASPVLQKPLELGADVVMYSTTKHIDGQGRTLGGIVLGSQEYVSNHLEQFIRHTGPAMSPFTAWTVLKSLETLSMRVNRMNDSAFAIAKFLADHKLIKQVRYPFLANHPGHEVAKAQMSGGGTTIGIELAKPTADVFKFLNALQVIDISNNLGDSKSLITHPASSTHRRVGEEIRAKMGISDSLVRLSVGLEHPTDLIQDLEQALAKI
jgi:O-succinylhomoserine sulfhydrylase